MSFSDHKITQFTHKITDLPDQPTLAPNELKARFDSSPEELRQAVNGICDDASRLEARVEGIVVDTFGDTIDREMLSDELAAELDAKATQAALTAEEQAREELSAQVAEITAVLPQLCELVCGSYESGTSTVTLGFAPLAVLSIRTGGVSGADDNTRNAVTLVTRAGGGSSTTMTLTSSGFTVTGEAASYGKHHYIALKAIG